MLRRMLDVPTLETPRLRLRGWRDEDLDAYAAMVADVEVMRFFGGEALERPAAWRHIALFTGHWALRGYGIWAVERREDGAFVGRSGLWWPEGWPGLEVGWVLAREHWGRGYATEAGAAARDWAFGHLDADRVIALIDADNDRSAAVARRLGMTDARETTVAGKLAREWELKRRQNDDGPPRGTARAYI